tara:strand:- start:630 stop:821 length:192 start_codon:yes stop_codon:yes gene_type:complete
LKYVPLKNELNFWVQECNYDATQSSLQHTAQNQVEKQYFFTAKIAASFLGRITRFFITEIHRP